MIIIEILCGVIFIIIWCIFLEIIATSGRCFDDKGYSNEPNWAENVVEYLRQKEEERKNQKKIAP